MNKLLAVLLTATIVGGTSVCLALLVGLFASEDVTGLVSVIVGCAFGTFAPDIYHALLKS